MRMRRCYADATVRLGAFIQIDALGLNSGRAAVASTAAFAFVQKKSGIPISKSETQARLRRPIYVCK
jgi:hypothetical protein